MIEDNSLQFGKTGSWTDLSNAAAVINGLSQVTASEGTAADLGGVVSSPSFSNNNANSGTVSTTPGHCGSRSHIVSDRALIVYQNADPKSGEPEIAQLLAKARVVLPAVMNYLYFNSAKVGVVYFGKRLVHNEKYGIRTGAEDFKIRMIRFLTAEIWPTLLRTDVPDESLGTDFLQKPVGGGAGGVRPSTTTATTTGNAEEATPRGQSSACSCGRDSTGVASPFVAAGTDHAPTRSYPSTAMPARQYSREAAQEVSWFRKSIENHMQVLLYLKKSVDGSKYLKVILNNSAHRIHFDVADTKEEKYRWELRMLYTRLMDNLETQKAIESYESYEASFRLACATSAANVMELERPLQRMTPVTLWGRTRHAKPVQLGVHTTTATDEDDENHDGGSELQSRWSDGDSTNESDFSEQQLASSPEVVGGAGWPPPLSNARFSPPQLPRPAASEDEVGENNNGNDGGGVKRLRAVELISFTPSVHRDPLHGTQHTALGRCDGNGQGGRKDSSGGGNSNTGSPLGDGCGGGGGGGGGASSTTEDAFTAHSRGATLNPSKARYYRWMENLQRPESATLDYKSYFSYTAHEIRHRCVKFMCGFLNAYREGKLVIGVHEIPRRDSDGNLETNKGGRNNIVLHNDLIDQYVVGVRISEAELEDVQEDVSQQLLRCVPPIPPETVAIDVVPIVYPEDFAYSQRVLILYEENNAGPSRDALKQKSNYTIRFLNPLGLSVIPLDLVDHQLEDIIAERCRPKRTGQPKGSQQQQQGSSSSNDDEPDTATGGGGDNDDDNVARTVSSEAQKSTSGCKARSGRNRYGEKATPPEAAPFNPEHLKAEAYVIAAIGGSAALTDTEWESMLSEAIGGAKSHCKHFFLDWPSDALGPLEVPQLNVVEVSVNMQRCGCRALRAYRGKFFCGWPSIPMWDAVTSSVRKVDRNYNLFGDALTTQEAAVLANSIRSCSGPPQIGTQQQQQQPTSPNMYLNLSTSAGAFQRAMVRHGWRWFSNLQIMNNVLAYLYGQRRVQDVLQFRRVHPVWNRVFENRQGTPLVHMIQSTPVGVPLFTNSAEHISRIQYAFLHAAVPPMPLILCRVYEIIGNLPFPYPFVAVPLSQQSFRVSTFLIPIFYRQHYFDGTMRISVVLDLRDGVLKTMQLRDGNLVLEAIVGMCFEKMNKRQVTRQLERIAAKRQADQLREARSRSKVTSRCSTPRHSTGPWRHKYATNFLARRTLQPQMLRHARGHLSSTILSPMLSESTRLTRREVEPNIPLIHFRFLTRQLLAEGSFIVSDSPVPEASQPQHQQSQEQGEVKATAATGGGRPPLPTWPSPFAQQQRQQQPYQRQGTSWTLQHLLSWYNALLTDTAHVRFFGYCDRSIAFDVADFTEICADDVEHGAVDLASVKDTRFASCRENCTLHRKALEWMNV